MPCRPANNDRWKGRKRSPQFFGALLATLTLQAAGAAHADYVGSATNRIFLDPDAISDLLDGYDDGDELAYIMETTPADTGSINGHAAWQTLYVPDGVEVIGVEFVKSVGTSYVAIPASDTDQTYDGWGIRGSKSYLPSSGVTQLRNGYVNEIQQDTGIFFSNDATTHTTTTPIGPALAPTGVASSDIYNQWDYNQTLVFGIKTNLSLNGGKGNAPIISVNSGTTWTGIGSPVAGPDTYYTNDYDPSCNGAATCTGTVAACSFAADVQCVGPWNRIAYANSKLGGSGAVAPATAIGSILLTSVATGGGVTVSGGSPLPSDTNAVRWVHGQRTLGDIELSRVRFRITDVTDFLASFTDDTFCLESTGGDTSDIAAKDMPWRYYEPVHKCYEDLGGPSTDGIILKQFTHVDGAPSGGSFLNTGDVVGFAVTFTNTSGATLTNVTLTDTRDTTNLTLIEPGNVLCPYANYNGNLPGPNYTAASITSSSGVSASWAAVPSLAAGESFTVHLCGVLGAVAEGDVVSNTGDITYTRPNLTIGTQSSTASGTAGYGRVAGSVFFDPDND
ncbi:MAG: hypothetical protein ABR587_09275, partial [Candidatus Binatia bacterium]